MSSSSMAWMSGGAKFNVTLLICGIVVGALGVLSLFQSHDDTSVIIEDSLVDTGYLNSIKSDFDKDYSLRDPCTFIRQSPADDIFCHELLEPRGVKVVTYDPKTEHIASGPGNYCLDMYRILKRDFSCNTGDIVLDIGGNVGFFTMSAASLGFEVVAFEPSVANAKRIQTGAFVNRYTHRVTVINAGLGVKAGVLQLFINPDNKVLKSDGIVVNGPDDPAIETGWKTGRWYLSNVLITKLDDVAQEMGTFDMVKAVKIDVEGFESIVVSGGKEFFTNVQPKIIFMEFNIGLWNIRKGLPGFMSIAETLSFFTDLGYVIIDQKDYANNRDAPKMTAQSVLESLEKGGRRGSDFVFLKM